MQQVSYWNFWAFRGTKLCETNFSYSYCKKFAIKNCEDLEVPNFEREVFYTSINSTFLLNVFGILKYQTLWEKTFVFLLQWLCCWLLLGFKFSQLFERSFLYFYCNHVPVEYYEDLEVTNFEREVFSYYCCTEFVSKKVFILPLQRLFCWVLWGFRSNKFCESFYTSIAIASLLNFVRI